MRPRKKIIIIRFVVGTTWWRWRRRLLRLISRFRKSVCSPENANTKIWSKIQYQFSGSRFEKGLCSSSSSPPSPPPSTSFFSCALRSHHLWMELIWCNTYSGDFVFVFLRFHFPFRLSIFSIIIIIILCSILFRFGFGGYCSVPVSVAVTVVTAICIFNRAAYTHRYATSRLHPIGIERNAVDGPDSICINGKIARDNRVPTRKWRHTHTHTQTIFMKWNEDTSERNRIGYESMTSFIRWMGKIESNLLFFLPPSRWHRRRQRRQCGDDTNIYIDKRWNHFNSIPRTIY